MGFQLSPGVNVSEIDLTTVVPSVLTTAGAFAGTFKWGPANQVVLVDSEITLAKTFGTPDSNSAVSFFTSANFLSYGNNLSIVRAVGANSFNADANTSASNIQIANSDQFFSTLLNTDNLNAYGAFMSRFPGALGNSIAVSVIDTGNTARSDLFTSAPGTSDFAAGVGGSNDEIHIAVIDAGGLFSGTKNTVLETFPFVSKAVDAVNLNTGSTNYYKEVIFNQSKYIYAVDPADYANTHATWGTTAANKSFSAMNVKYQTFTLSGGTDAKPTDGDISQAYAIFQNKETYDISLVLTGDASTTVQKYVIDNIVGGSVTSGTAARGDCVAFISPPSAAVVNQTGSEWSNIQSWLNTLSESSSYTVADSGWKYQYDVYNNVYRWIPLNGDIAGLCVNTDNTRDPWYSPAGFNRGAIKNVIKLSWNPSKTYRDTLYAAGVNPVVSFAGQGAVLFGDKTLQSKPSAFDRINVRRLFIVLEKAISKAAQYSLFELNDEFTRAQFVSLVTPFLRDVQGRRGITDFKVVCDTTNNTPQVIDSNQFVGDIYIKPARSINYIQLNFIAVGTGVDFNTIVGAV
jgi:Phage tail sheath protein subtilisin-like domain/Phage tail sheath C-terminal domain